MKYFKYWVQDQEEHIHEEYNNLEEAVIKASEWYNSGLNPIIWKTLFKEDDKPIESYELATFFHEED